MKMNIWTHKRLLSVLFAVAVVGLPLAAQAQRRSPLADAPAIRKREELRAFRLEAGAGWGSTINQDFYHTEFINLKLGFHLTDWLSLSGFAGFAVANVNTGFQGRVTDSLASGTPSPRDPTADIAKASMQKITQILGLQLEFAPFTGKYSLFGKLFAHYDFYALLGGGFLNVSPTNAAPLTPCSDTYNPAIKQCAVSGLKPGFNVGVGMHTYFNQWFGLNVELRDIVARLNPSGRDVNGDGSADNNDLAWSSTYMVSASLVFYLPPTADISP
jgi:outer membrane beta-barrel protein